MNKYRIFSETFVTADNEDDAFDVGYEWLKGQDYEIEKVD